MCYTGKCKWEIGYGENIGECNHPKMRLWAYLVSKGTWIADDPWGPDFSRCLLEESF
jgi:hypothetical protein